MDNLESRFCPRSYSIFVGNLPQDIYNLWLRRIFRICGPIVSAYSPFSRKGFQGSRFGFVTFQRQTDAEFAICRFNGSWLRNKKLIVDYAKSEARSWETPIPCFHSVTNLDLQDCSVGDNLPDFRNSKDAPVLKEIEAIDLDEEWLSDCLIGNAKFHSLIPHIEEELRAEGAYIISVKPIGGNYCLLQDLESKNRFIVRNQFWLVKWFESLQDWTTSVVNSSRRVWLSVSGVPLRAWSEHNFRSIGRSWGDVLLVHPQTSLRDKLEIDYYS